MELQQDEKMNQIFDGSKGSRTNVYTTYMKRNHLQRFVLDFSTIRITANKWGVKDSNIEIEGRAIDIKHKKVEWLDNNEQITFIAPKITFAWMCKNAGFDFRNDYNKYQISMKVFTQKRYELIKRIPVK